ncbi:MAG: hypothetical protein ACRDWT_18480 [Jatrophihabitantaceae bacterium]
MTMRERLRAVRGDEGTSLMELIVGMSLMAIFMAMFTGAIVLMTSSANKVEAVTVSSGQVNEAFLRLDKLVRYASAISAPAQSTGGSSTGDWYVEMSVPNVGGVFTCVQLRVDTTSQQLQQRTWTVTSDNPPVVSAASTFVPLASQITNQPTDTPFVLGTDPKSLFQQLQITVLSAVSSPATASSKTSVTFTALNSTLNPPASICQQWGRP